MTDARTRLLLCLSLVGVGLIVIAGWLLDIAILKSLLPGFPTMKFNTAVGFVLAGGGLAAAGAPDVRLRWVAAITGAMLGLLGAATLAEYLAHVDLGIDQLVAFDTGSLAGSGVPGRMSPLTATAWMAIGPAIAFLALSRRDSGIITAHALAGYAGFVAFLAAAGYAFGAQAFWGIGTYTFMAVPTAVGLLIAGGAALLTRADEGWLAGFRDAPDARELLVQLLPISVFLPACLGFLLLFASGLGAFNAPFAFALFVPAMTVALIIVVIRVAKRARVGELALRASEAAVRSSEERLSTALAIARLGTFDWDLINDRITVDARTREIFGLAENEPVTRETIIAHIHPEDLQRVLAEIRASQNAMSRRESEYRIIAGDGLVKTIVSLSDVTGRDRAERIFGVFGDISERKRLEEALRQLNESLEERVRERTDELERVHEQLRQSQKLEAMGQLTGGVAHDFNNLLSPIIGSLDMLRRNGFEGERTNRLLDAALMSAEKAKNLVHRLLAFARRQPLQPAPLDLSSLLSEMHDLIAATLGPRIRLEVDVPPVLPPAQADANQLEMAILNLAVNARDAMPDGGVLTISATAEDISEGSRAQLRPGQFLRLRVADTGIGMDEATLQRAVEPFFSTKGVGRGTGLGLSMIHGFAAQLGGELRLNSTPEEGTQVELWLPAADGMAEVVRRPTAGDPVNLSGLALLVDDEDAVRASTAAMLSDLGYRVVEAASAEEAIERVDGGLSPDVLVTDHLMPGMTGTELARTLQDRRPDLPILIVSGYAELDQIAPDLKRLPKPFRQIEIADALASLRQAAA